MATVTYEARRNLVSYHVSGSDYSLDLDTSALAPPSGSDIKTRTESLNGSVETLYFGRKRIWSATTIPVQASSGLCALIYEFLGSTADGQEFAFDPYGTGELLTVIREDDGYTSSIFSQINGVDDYLQFTFQVREV